MKTRWLITACAAALLVFTGIAAVAQDRGQSQTQYRKFTKKQQQATHTYYEKNKEKPEFKQPDQWNNDYESRLQPGYVLDDDMQKMSHPAPAELTRSLGRPPRGFNDVVIGQHVVRVDSQNRVHDTIHLHN